MILVIDNYDSFAYNLVQYAAEVAAKVGENEQGAGVVVRRNDAIDLDDIRHLDPAGIIVSPGPGTPATAGISKPIFAETDYPTLGVCLGHQALCAANGAPVIKAPEVVHGKSSVIKHDGKGIFEGLPNPFRAGRYHSLCVRRSDVPSSLLETAVTVEAGMLTDEPKKSAGTGPERVDSNPEFESDEFDSNGEILMGVRHRDVNHIGLQFHPESILTGPPTERESGTAASLEVGKRLIANFWRMAH